ncbi:MAG TPA: response regulator [Candidatus Angelobacter sp.]|nr:response regulator [Candidatus Angelobacter sp.]
MNTSNNPLEGGRLAEILLVEDNENDAELTRLAFRRSGLTVSLHHVRDGEECMAFLRKQGKFASAPDPDLVLLDLNMPRMDGRAVLAEVVGDKNLCHLPIVVLSTSSQHREALDIYKLRCNSYIVKPIEFDQFVNVIRTVCQYWFGVVVLPSETAKRTSQVF